MKAIMTGLLEEGLIIHDVVRGNEADEIVIRLRAEGKPADTLSVYDPATLQKGLEEFDPDGKSFVVYGKGLANGFQMYGPFTERDDADEFAEENRDSDADWEIFEFSR
jgi:hypothetical protein